MARLDSINRAARRRPGGARGPAETSLRNAGQPLDQVHRAMLAAGAADRDRQIAAIGAHQLRDPVLQERDDVVEHSSPAAWRSRNRRTAGRVRSVAPGPVPSTGSAGCARRKRNRRRPARRGGSEGFEQDRHAAFDAAADALADQLAQLVHAGARGIDDRSAASAIGSSRCLFLPDRLGRPRPSRLSGWRRRVSL